MSFTLSSRRRPRKHHEPPTGGFTLVELLAVIAIIALLLGVTLSLPGVLSSERGTTAMQQIISVLDSARARALGSTSAVWVVFADGNAASPAWPFQSYMICREEAPTATSAAVLVPVSSHEKLPDGVVFCDTAPALPTAGENILSLPAARRAVRLGDTVVQLPALSFGTLGEVSFPGSGAAPVLVAVVEGHAEGAKVVTAKGTAPEAWRCRWIAVHRNTGKAVLLP